MFPEMVLSRVRCATNALVLISSGEIMDNLRCGFHRVPNDPEKELETRYARSFNKSGKIFQDAFLLTWEAAQNRLLSFPIC